MVSRMALIVWVLESKVAYWLYEQPHTSLMFEHPRMQELLKALKVWRAHMYMGAYGAASPKPTFLWAPSETVSWFSLPLPKKDWEAMVDKKTMPDGSIQVSGNKKLKGSQTYPKEFGLSTVRVWNAAPKRKFVPLKPKAKPAPIWKPLSKADSWPDADLTGVMQYLSLGTFK